MLTGGGLPMVASRSGWLSAGSPNPAAQKPPTRLDTILEDVWHQPYVQIPTEYLVSNFQFRFRAKMSGAEEDANVDNVQLVATSIATGGTPDSLSIADVSKFEGNKSTTTFAFIVTRSGSTAGPVTASYAKANGTALAGSDYTATSGTLSFAAGVTSQAINVSVTGDRTAEPSSEGAPVGAVIDGRLLLRAGRRDARERQDHWNDTAAWHLIFRQVTDSRTNWGWNWLPGAVSRSC